MATKIEYSHGIDLEYDFFDIKTKVIGYLSKEPIEVLKELISEFYVVDYLGFRIPSKSVFDSDNTGLTISHQTSGIGLDGKVSMLNKSPLFSRSKHEPFTLEQRKNLSDETKKKLAFQYIKSDPLRPDEAKVISDFFDVLGFPTPIEELIEITTYRRSNMIQPYFETFGFPIKLKKIVSRSNFISDIGYGEI